MKLIDAENFVVLLAAWQRELSPGSSHTDAVTSGTLQGVIDLIVIAPRVDAEPVVRCRDCMNAMPLSDAERRIFTDECMVCSMGRGDSTLGYSIVEPADFCNKGIRKEAEENDPD